MSAILQWVSMGGYSLFVWPAYGVVCLVLGLNALGVRWQRNHTMKRLHQWFKRQ